MASSTKPATTTKTTSKPRPADTCRMTVTIRGESYTVRPVRSQTPDIARAWRLRKADGTIYDVCDTLYGASCDCADQVYRHEGRDSSGCKHIKSLRALGLIDQDGEGPEDWPSWTDSVAFATAVR